MLGPIRISNVFSMVLRVSRSKPALISISCDSPTPFRNVKDFSAFQYLRRLRTYHGDFTSFSSTVGNESFTARQGRYASPRIHASPWLRPPCPRLPPRRDTGGRER